MTEADTCRKYVVPKLLAAGWEDEPHSPEWIQRDGAEETETFSFTPRAPADEMRRALNNLNADLVRGSTGDSSPGSTGDSPVPAGDPPDGIPFFGPFPNHVCRLTADEGDIGRGHMQTFQDVETATPAILTTSQLLSTGLDAPTCKNVVIARLVNSMIEFKQIIGRGTRVRDDYGMLNYLRPEAREILDLLLEQHASDGELQLVAVRKHLPNVLKVPQRERNVRQIRRGGPTPVQLIER